MAEQSAFRRLLPCIFEGMASRIPFNSAQEQAVLAALATFPSRDRCLVIVALNTGFRVSELSAIIVDDVYDGQRVRPEITVERCHMKGGRGVRRRCVRSRTIPLNTSARSAIQAYLESRDSSTGLLDPDAPLFPGQRGGPLRRWQINRIVHRAAAVAGIRSLDRIGTHSLRKTFAKKIYEASGNDINATRATLGHSRVNTTQTYLYVEESKIRSLVLAIG